MIKVSAFAWVPEFAQGHVRDLRVRWALEEAGLPYASRLLRQGDQDKPEYRAMQPFGQVRRPAAVAFLQKRPAGLSAALGDKPFLDGNAFTVGDLMMTTVLRIKEETAGGFANLRAYIDRCTARPAFQAALAAQFRDFQKGAKA